MKKYNLAIGIPVSLLIAALVNLPRIFITGNTGEFVQYTLAYFAFACLSWMANQWFIRAAWFKKPVYGKLLYFLIPLITGVSFCYVFDYSFIHNFHTVFHNPLLDKTRKFLIIVLRGTLFNMLNAFLVLHIHKMKEHEQSRLELEQLKRAQLQANMVLLKEQLSPHFMFNTLNTLTTLTKEQKVIDFVEQLSNVYRYLLSHQKHDWVPLKEELEFLQSYLYIIKTRLENAIDISIEVGQEVWDCKIPPLTLQLLIENAVKHNITASSRPLHIRIYTTAEGLVVINNLQLKQSVASSSGIGLNNIAQRYQLLYNATIQIEHTSDHQFKVTLPLLL
ncbi:Histidine kinase [Filimonas lacunae]|uniref:Histidine kinase n=1 Tax=Filimonas lacunae TaxID=477680 RepID=A0A173MJ40_9BACT|nr:histidine kinase [Filimonas lacunae]BAV07486.1 two-component system sensor protein histidine kinase [Filimonas lacunae]SIT30201.1 Histidine kinase [Filimonas lacunae]